MTAGVGADASPSVPVPVPAVRSRLRVAGVLLGRFDRSDGRRGRFGWEAEQLVAHFVPSTVPLLSRHGGLPIGYLSELQEEGMGDLSFRSTLVARSDVTQRLRDGCPVSVELSYIGRWRTSGPGNPTRPGEHSYFRGQRLPGINLVGVALVEHAAARGSVCWTEAATDADDD